MRIVDVCAFLSPHGGGVRSYIAQKLAIAPRLGHDMTIIAPADQDGLVEHGPGARIVYLKAPRLPVDRNYWYFGDEPALQAALDAAAPDFIEVSSPWRSASMVARWPGAAPRVMVMHADPMSAYAYRWFEPMPRELVDRGFEPFWQHLREMGTVYDAVICANRELRARLIEGGVGNAVFEPMGVDAGTFSPKLCDPALRAEMLAMCDLPDTAHLLLGVGRLAKEKRWPLVVDAVARASQHRPLGLLVLGAGGQRARVLKAIGGNPHIRLIEPIRDRAAFATLLASADALIHGCEAETFCLAAAEARASGIPVIVPDRGGAADHAADGCGLTYRAGDPLAAARAIDRLFDKGLHPPPLTPRTMDDHFADLFARYRGLVDAAGKTRARAGAPVAQPKLAIT